MSTPLINIQDVIDFADLSVNIKEKKYNQYIISAQERFLSDLIGVDCLNGLIDRKCANTLTTEDNALLSLIKPYLISYSYSLYVGSSMKLSLNSGIATLNGDNATVIGQQSRTRESKSYVLLAERQGLKILTFLSDNSTLYPCYTVPTCGTEINTHNPYFGL